MNIINEQKRKKISSHEVISLTDHHPHLPTSRLEPIKILLPLEREVFLPKIAWCLDSLRRDDPPQLMMAFGLTYLASNLRVKFVCFHRWITETNSSSLSCLSFDFMSRVSVAPMSQWGARLLSHSSTSTANSSRCKSPSLPRLQVFPKVLLQECRSVVMVDSSSFSPVQITHGNEGEGGC